MTSSISDIVVVDTNVAIVANGRNGMSSDCVKRCAEHINLVSKTKTLAVDEAWEIVKEYMRHLKQEGQPGVGDAFLKWVLTNHANPKRCVKVVIRRCEARGDPVDYREFPDHEGLAGFDPSDKKFVAVSNARRDKPDILQGSDSKWLEWCKSLRECGVRVLFVCEDELREVAAGKAKGQ
ncbi:MAG: hypothetical protein FKY71_10445 [Spiribacter salinus]|uniref:PIN domain-containing protein n=1 Tax=Spiribacter salinus TaxID=1335746 RepID=A0A540VQP6_9GAMM|nr:MAG: hypothetical protein FKY71_10445 [Spiribacter salinus]